MNVISLFNGMGTLRQAMHDLNIKVDGYYSSEIKPYAIELQQHHFPDVIQVGDINNWKQWDIDWKTIDFIGSGSPCQDLSIAGNRKGLKGDRSSLFYVFVEILNHVKKLNPNVKFLQENVGSAPIEAVGEMSRALGVYPVRWNSSLVTAQMRDRYYWTNIKMAEYGMFGDMITDIPPPQDQGIMFEDVILDGAVYVDKAQALLESEAKTYGYKDMGKFTALIKRRIKAGRQLPNFVFTYKKKANAILESESRPSRNEETLLKRHLEMAMSNVVNDNGTVRILNKTEMCRLQGFPDNYCDSITRNKAASLLGGGWTLPIIVHILSFLKGEEKK
jgi:site-specific DNA-cytosine methylase